jgi:opacity protein-like surface antigen
MPSFRTMGAAAVLLVSMASPARAQGFIAPFIGFNFGGDSSNCASLSSCEEKRLNWGASLGTVNGVLGFEEEIGYASQFFGKTPGGDNAMLTLMSNLMVVIPAGPIQPYGVIGIGLMRSHAQFNTSSLSLSNNSLGWDIGGGLNIFLAHSIGIRGDIRRLKTLQDVTLGVFGNDKVEFWRASAGLVFRF